MRINVFTWKKPGFGWKILAILSVAMTLYALFDDIMNFASISLLKVINWFPQPLYDLALVGYAFEVRIMSALIWRKVAVLLLAHCLISLPFAVLAAYHVSDEMESLVRALGGPIFFTLLAVLASLLLAMLYVYIVAAWRYAEFRQSEIGRQA
jgi:hypothetical protein